jgi:formylglycine-generating enzyme required for sulfatase activity
MKLTLSRLISHSGLFTAFTRSLILSALIVPIVASAQREPEFNASNWQLPNEDLLGFVEIPAGSFAMGSDPRVDPMAFANERWSNFMRQGNVNLPTFYIQRYEVTTAQYRAFADVTGYQANPQSLSQADIYPAAYVSWTDALAYARWLDNELRTAEQTPAAIKELLHSGWKITLPSEAQWEKAARGTEGNIFPWGNQPDASKANIGSAASDPVGDQDCSNCAYGLADMSGNLFEWTRSPYQPYPYTSADDRDNLMEDALWIIRGGSFNDPINNARAAVRGAADPGARRDFIGFRLVLTPE